MRQQRCARVLMAALCLVASAVAGPQDNDVNEHRIRISSSVEMGFWGRVIMNTHLDTEDIRGNTDFATYVTGEASDEVNFNPRDTRLGFKTHSVFDGWHAGLVAEADFYGDNAGNNLTPRLRLGYVKLEKNDLSFRLGQDWIPLGQQNPGMVDFGILAWGGNLWWRVPQLTVRKQSGKFQWLGSLMKHRISNDQESQEKWPWMIGRLAWQSDGHLVAVGAGYRSVEVNGIEYDPFLTVLEFKTGLGGKASIKGELWHGAGHGREFIRYGLDYNPVMADTIRSSGGFVSVHLPMGDRNHFNLGVGLDHPDEEDLSDGVGGIIATAPFVENQVIFANYQRKLSKQFSYGIEVLHIDTEQRDRTNIDSQRFTLSVAYIF
ncbi:hypothetical protein SCOR_27860 [Sulfidibacter corallicola]|uniref:Porin n=1 Tax=Sulfidibacter corallicola TaxID=2818388 RepID=A0A8A4TMD4_SULCO|nr:hypothetical protein [Sulfidibacter corallicola]QTD50627.1 hypothetical protein J3U87_34005 [Sulfidibacter corallicola]